MRFEIATTLPPADVFTRAKQFFAERNPATSAFPEKEGAGYLVLRGQGGEEVALAAFADGSATRVRASTLLFDQALGRFLSTLPTVEETP